MSEDDHTFERPLSHLYKESGKQGLANLGCTCYANTAIQCLSYCLPFLHYVLELSSRDIRVADKNFDLMHELHDVMQMMWKQNKSIIPRRFIKTLRLNLGSLLDVDEQNDIQEFVSIIVDKLNSCVGNAITPQILAKLSAISTNVSPLELFHHKSRSSWLTDHKNAYSPLVDMLYGQQVNQITCDGCHGVSHVFETFLSIMLSFDDDEISKRQDNKDDIGRMIARTLKKETLASRECDQCKQTISGTSIQRYYRLPQVLILNIKRFGSIDNVQKVTKEMAIHECIDLSSLCLDTSIKHRYRLDAIACHVGNMHNGHYFAVCRHPDDSWLMIDDESVKPLAHFTNIPSSHYYMLFYTSLDMKDDKANGKP